MKPLPFKLRQQTELEKWRADTFWTKEPETLNWIDSFGVGDTFLDIGANIGLYSLYAASRGIAVTAVEPHQGNFTALTINTRQLNRHLPIRIVWACMGDVSGKGTFTCEEMTAGSTGGGYSLEHGLTIPIYVYTVDKLMGLQSLGAPFDHIKIDVDGEEKQIVEGMNESMDGQYFKSCLIEVGPDTAVDIMRRFRKAGYTLFNAFNAFQPHSTTRRTADGIEVENIVFTLDQGKYYDRKATNRMEGHSPPPGG